MEKLGVGWEEKSVSVSSLNYNLLYRFNFYDHVMFYILKNKMTEMRNEKQNGLQNDKPNAIDSCTVPLDMVMHISHSFRR